MRKLFAVLMVVLSGLSGTLIFLDAAGLYSIARPLSLWLLFVICAALALAEFQPPPQP